MDPGNYFSDHQRRTLSTLWIPGLIFAVIGLITCCFIDERLSYYRNAYQDTFSLTFFVTTLKWAIAYAWEPVMRKDFKKALIIIFLFWGLNFKFKQLTNFIEHLPPFIDTALLSITWVCIQVIGVCYITGKKNYWQTGVVAGLFICYITDVPPNPLGYIHFDTFSLLNVLADFSLPFLIYGWIYLAENFFGNKDYKELLHSKIQVISAKEYLFLFPLVAISCWTIILQSAGFMSVLSPGQEMNPGFSNFQSDLLLTNAITFVAEICIFYVCAHLTRNIVMSRMNTIANANGYMYMLHFIPVANIIAWIKFYKNPEVHSSQDENAFFYNQKHITAIKNYIIGLGILLGTLDLYTAYQHTRYEVSAASRILFMLMFAKLINYFYLEKKGEKAIISLVAIACMGSITQVFSLEIGSRSFSSSTLALALSYFFMMEIFDPKLKKQDNDELPPVVEVDTETFTTV